MSPRFNNLQKQAPAMNAGASISAGIGMLAGIIVVAIALWFASLFFSQRAHAHDTWISRGALKNQAGEWCCGDNDCQELNYTPRPVAGGVQLDNGETILQSDVMPLSPEGWVICRRPDGTRRCVFAPPSGS